MREKKDSKKYINKCVCRVTTPATLLNYTEMEWKMRARLLVWCGDAVHSEQTVGGGHFTLYSRTPDVIILISSSYCFFLTKVLIRRGAGTLFLSCVVVRW